MAEPRVLSKPPIAEALVDFATISTQPQEVFEAFARSLADRYPKTAVDRQVNGQFIVKNGKVVPPDGTGLRETFRGVRATSSDGTLMVQCRPDGFTLNNLQSYVGGDRLIDEALDVWRRFLSIGRQQSVTRVAFRYINQLALPMAHGEPFEKYLTASPQMPPGATQYVREFLSRVVARSPAANAELIVTQRMQVPQGTLPVVLLDIDVFQQGDFSTDPEKLRAQLQLLRAERNRTFFAMLTEEAVALYV